MNELYHYGIPGMRWGVRRYQNRDGTLTPEGQQRYMSPYGRLRYNVDIAKSNVVTGLTIGAAMSLGAGIAVGYGAKRLGKIGKVSISSGKKYAQRIARKVSSKASPQASSPKVPTVPKKERTIPFIKRKQQSSVMRGAPAEPYTSGVVPNNRKKMDRVVIQQH